MERVGLPLRLREVGYEAEDVPVLVAGAEKQRRLLACAPVPERAGHPGDLGCGAALATGTSAAARCELPGWRKDGTACRARQSART